MNWSEKLLELEGKATEGKWKFYDDSNDGKTNRMEISAIGKTIAHIYRSVPAVDGPNAQLIVHLRNRAKEIAALVQLVERHACPIRLGSHGADNCVCEYCQALAALEGES